MNDATVEERAPGAQAAAGGAIDALVAQVSAPVQWEAVIKRLASEGVTTYVEVGPGRVLGGLVKKVHKEARVLSFAEPVDLQEILESAK